jgi:hypothetical protein
MMAASRFTARCVVVAAVAAIAHAQPVTPGERSSIHGRVVADETGEPLRNARITIVPGEDLRPVLTDAEGRFVIAGVPGGSRAHGSKNRLGDERDASRREH